MRRDDWRNDPITQRQRECIETMMEFSQYPIPVFDGTTKGEASDYIDKYGKLAYEDVDSPTYGY